MRGARLLRGVRLALGACLVALVLLAFAWWLSNLHDAPPRPMPPALALPTPQLNNDANAFFALIALRAGPDVDVSRAGADLWRERLKAARDFAHHADPERLMRDNRAADAALGIPDPTSPGPPFACVGSTECTAAWLAHPQALSRQLRTLRPAGQRCEALLGEGFAFEELLPPLASTADPIALHGVGAAFCARWLRSAAVLAWSSGRRDEALRSLRKADRLARTLIGAMIALRLTRDTLDTAAEIALRDAGMAASLEELAAPLPDAAQAVRRWMVFEAAFQRAAFDSVTTACDQAADPPSFDPMPWMCRHRLEQALLGEAGLPGLFEWRNTFGAFVRRVGSTAFVSYVARHADTELQRETVALVLALQTARVAATERPAWSARYPLSASARERLTWSPSGMALRARPFEQEIDLGASATVRSSIVFEWPKAGP